MSAPISFQVVIDHNFELVAEAREQLLRLGRKELEDPTTTNVALRGAHVVAPVRSS